MIIDNLLCSIVRHQFRRRVRLMPGASLPRPLPPSGRARLLYLHVPFCEHLCPFCSFHRVDFQPELARRYFGALREDIRAWHRLGYRFSDVYVGGGTPTVLPDELDTTLALLRELFPVRSLSVETNPNHLREELLGMLRDRGVDRLSVGVQSFEDRLLQRLGRLRAYGSGAEILVRLERTQGRFPTLNIDTMFNLPRQTMEALQRDIGIVRDRLEVEQVSYYPLMSTPATRRALAKSLGRATAGHEEAYYRAILEGLRPKLQPASAWCFSRRPAALDEYIVDHRDFAAAGSGTFSYLDGTLYASTFSIERYLALVTGGCSPLVARQALTPRERCRYALLMGLFGLRLDKGPLRADCGEAALNALRWELLALKAMGTVAEDADRLYLTERGLYHWVALMREFFVGVNGLREDMHAQDDFAPDA